MNVSIRPYDTSDKKACLDLFDSNVPRYFDSSERSDFAGFLDGPDGDYFVIEQDQQICGCGGFAKEDHGQARFTWGMVDHDRHGSGLGRMLAEYRLQAIKSSGRFQEVELFTTPQIAPFFKKFGFEIENVEKDGFAPNMDKVQMILRLTGDDSEAS